MEESRTIEDRRAAAAFEKARQRRILFTLMGRELSLSELAFESKTALSLLHHHVQRLMDLGLVQVTAVRRRAGAPVKLYRATARSYFVPAELSTKPTADLNHVLRSTLERTFTGALKGVLYSHDGTRAQIKLVRDPEFAARALELWGELDLNATDAADLAAEFRQILQRYAKGSGTHRRRYIVHAAIAPR